MVAITKMLTWPSGIISIKGISQDASIMVYNGLGSVVLSTKGTHLIDLSSYGKGMFYIRITENRSGILKTVIIE